MYVCSMYIFIYESERSEVWPRSSRFSPDHNSTIISHEEDLSAFKILNLCIYMNVCMSINKALSNRLLSFLCGVSRSEVPRALWSCPPCPSFGERVQGSYYNRHQRHPGALPKEHGWRYLSIYLSIYLSGHDIHSKESVGTIKSNNSSTRTSAGTGFWFLQSMAR